MARRALSIALVGAAAGAVTAVAWQPFRPPVCSSPPPAAAPFRALRDAAVCRPPGALGPVFLCAVTGALVALLLLVVLRRASRPPASSRSATRYVRAPHPRLFTWSQAGWWCLAALGGAAPAAAVGYLLQFGGSQVTPWQGSPAWLLTHALAAFTAGGALAGLLLRLSMYYPRDAWR